MPFSLPSLPYAYGALEPYIDTLTMEIHHTKHHQGYVTNLNKALEAHADLQEKTVKELISNLDALPQALQAVVRNNGGGHYNHSLFWKIMSVKGPLEPVGLVAEKINKKFGSFDVFKDQFSVTAKSVFGSGWAWLCLDSNGDIIISSTPNQDSPVMQGYEPLLGLDVWEHAYYLHYQNRRPDYIASWWSVVNWEQVEENYRELL